MKTVSRALESILSQIDESFEVIVVDSESNDGSEKILRSLEESGKIKLVTKKCTRGKGRQIAHDLATGEYEIDQIDLDNIYKPTLMELLGIYHNRCEGTVMRPNEKPITIAPRQLITDIGGWRDLQNCEDWDIWSRAAKLGRYSWIKYDLVQELNPHDELQTLMGKINHSYYNNRERIRLGRNLTKKGEKQSILVKVIILYARIRSKFMKNYNDPLNKEFRALDPKYQREIKQSN